MPHNETPTPRQLSTATLRELPANIATPTYDRTAITPGIVHFGLGGFHRAHQALYLDDLMRQGSAHDYGICGVGVLAHDAHMRDVMAAQDCLYTLMVKHSDGRREGRVIGSIVEYLFAPDTPELVIERMASPTTKIVSLTITEGGYNYNQVTGEFNSDSPEILADVAALQGGAAPATTFGLITAALQQRRAAAQTPFTVMSCDNLQGNGELAHRMFVAFANLVDPDLGTWIDANVTFPNSMVDRITPVTSAADREQISTELGLVDAWPVVCEPFIQWVVEDKFSNGRPPFENVGVQVVADVVPYELMKLRLLNASHQGLTYFGHLAGLTYAHEVCQDPLFSDFLLRYMHREGAPTLQSVPGVDLNAYCDGLIARFSNEHVQDTLARLCAESSDRIPKWLVPVIRENVAAGRPVNESAAIVASWARYAEGRDEQGQPIEIVDRHRERVQRTALQYPNDELAFIRDREFFGDLSENDDFVAAYSWALKSLHEVGSRQTLEALAARSR